MFRNVGQGRVAALLIAVVAFVAGVAGVAAARTPASDVAVTDFATGFTNTLGVGPIGLAFDGGGRLYVSDDHDLYRFNSGGGAADADHHVNSAAISGSLFGLAFGKDGKLYAARHTAGESGDVVELDPSSGRVLRTVVGNLPCPTGLAVDPISGDLFTTTSECGNTIVRIAGGRATTYLSNLPVDGLTFAPDGTLYVAHEPTAAGVTVSSITGTSSANPGVRTPIAKLHQADGIALAASPTAGGTPPFLIVNRNDGTITKVDLADPAHPTRDLMTGGTRGDFVTVAPDGCLYATQTDEVLKVTNADGTCRHADDDGTQPALGQGLEPAGVRITPPAGAFLQITGGSRAASSCRTNRHLTVRFRAPGGIKISRARLFVKGHYNRTVSGKALRRHVTVKKLPVVGFRLTIRATTKTGRRLVVHRRYGACAGL